MTHPIFPLQTVLAERIINKLKICNFVLYCAPMQSGKTGSIIETARLFKGKVYFLTGVADLQVEEQNYIAFKDTKIQILNKFDLSNGIQKQTLDFLRKTVKRHSLIIIDEAHYGVGKTNLLSIPFIYLMKELECKVVCVSATNWVAQLSIMGEKSEIVAPTHAELTAAGYKGPDYYNNMIDLGDDTNPSTNGIQLFPALQEFKKVGGYFIIRDNGGKFFKNYKDNTLLRGIKVIEWNCETPTAFQVEALSVKPKNPTIILIKDFLRMGKVLPNKQYIYGVWESSKDTLDTVMQGLVGRMCGYPNCNPDLKIYVCKSQVRVYLEVMKNEFKMDESVYLSMNPKKKLSRMIKNDTKIVSGGTVRRISQEEYEYLRANESKSIAFHRIDENDAVMAARYQHVMDTLEYNTVGMYKKRGKTRLVLIEGDKNGPNRYVLAEPNGQETKRIVTSAKTNNSMFNLNATRECNGH